MVFAEMCLPRPILQTPPTYAATLDAPKPHMYTHLYCLCYDFYDSVLLIAFLSSLPSSELRGDGSGRAFTQRGQDAAGAATGKKTHFIGRLKY